MVPHSSLCTAYSCVEKSMQKWHMVKGQANSQSANFLYFAYNDTGTLFFNF